MANEQISLPSLLIVLVVSGVVIRYLFFSAPSQPRQQQPPRAAGEAASRARETAVERIQQMFPQIDRRTILWDLQRTRGNITATTERILSGRIETPPVTFQPPLPPTSPSPSSSSQNQAPKPPPKPSEPDLITRYNLQSQLSENPEETADSKPKGWSSNRSERQSALQKRRDDMILQARRKMEAKLAAERAACSSS